MEITKEEKLIKQKEYYFQRRSKIRKQQKEYYDKTHPNVGTYFYKVERVCKFCGKHFKVKPSVIKKGSGLFCSLTCMGYGRSKDVNRKMSLTKKGKHYSPATEFKINQKPWNAGKHMLQITGSNHPLWKGGITPINEKIRKSLEYRTWRKSVFLRDNYTCVICGKRCSKGNTVYIHADHIKPFSLYPNLRFEVSNGRTLCVSCHKDTDTWGVNNLKKCRNERSN